MRQLIIQIDVHRCKFDADVTRLQLALHILPVVGYVPRKIVHLTELLVQQHLQPLVFLRQRDDPLHVRIGCCLAPQALYLVAVGLRPLVDVGQLWVALAVQQFLEFDRRVQQDAFRQQFRVVHQCCQTATILAHTVGQIHQQLLQFRYVGSLFAPGVHALCLTLIAKFLSDAFANVFHVLLIVVHGMRVVHLHGIATGNGTQRTGISEFAKVGACQLQILQFISNNPVQFLLSSLRDGVSVRAVAGILHALAGVCVAQFQSVLCIAIFLHHATRLEECHRLTVVGDAGIILLIELLHRRHALYHLGIFVVLLVVGLVIGKGLDVALLRFSIILKTAKGMTLQLLTLGLHRPVVQLLVSAQSPVNAGDSLRVPDICHGKGIVHPGIIHALGVVGILALHPLSQQSRLMLVFSRCLSVVGSKSHEAGVGLKDVDLHRVVHLHRKDFLVAFLRLGIIAR